MSSQKKAALLGGLLLAVALGLGLHLRAKLAGPEPVFWLAELWAPTAFLSYGFLSFLELLKAGRQRPQAPATKRARRRKP
jgi:hypothetical protein